MVGKKKNDAPSSDAPSGETEFPGDKGKNTSYSEEKPKNVRETGEPSQGSESTPLLAKEKSKEGKAAPQSLESKKKGSDLEAGLKDEDAKDDNECATCCHMFFVVLRTCTIVALLCMATSQILLIVGLKDDVLKNSLRVDVIIFCLAFIIVEVDGPAWLVKRFSGVKNWIMRG
eukprot:CAMPEP_0113598446 /NCGR_PEP_ID=MMETSP0015_2-20120614/41594_1 /TAXON_ID=2838 /ORGANISM="Odontella" /LENGTH=172 /DNA_ID=CAMNT_0000506469 /DNA_START=101 /DNA_END=616 /DNA_ORIENTATION=- /assembly_acc=CAM_ASM_000160